jgi:tRNA U34 5-carboxymethylaminomethyl modifying GTPase MnmE/TrmE
MSGKNKKDKEEQPTFNVSGNIEGGIVNMGGEQTFHGPIVFNLNSHFERSIQSVESIPSADAKTKDELVALTNQLKQLLEKMPSGNEEMVEQVAKRLNTLMEEASAKKPDHEMVQITAEGLKKAAQNLAAVVPTILPICIDIVKVVTRI